MTKKQHLKGGIKNSKGTIVMQFSLPGCVKCGLLDAALRLTRDEDEYQYELHEIMAIEDDKTHPLASEYKIESAPTVVIFHNGSKIAKIVQPFIEQIKMILKEIKNGKHEKTKEVGVLSESAVVN
jgi:thioredoxin-related protein